MALKSKRQNVIISIPLIWSVRNFVLSGLITRLSAHYNVIVYTSSSLKNYVVESGISKDNILICNRFRPYSKFRNLVNIFFVWLHPELGYVDEVQRRNNKTSRFSRYCLSSGFSRFFLKEFYRILEGCYLRLSLKSLDDTFNNAVVNLEPRFILSTSFVIGSEMPLFLAARKNRIPLYTHVLSFDNITSRGYLPLKLFDRFYCWNENMSIELNKYYGIPLKYCVITGTPQFDFHRIFFGKENSDINAAPFRNSNYSEEYVLYCANHEHHTPMEPLLLRAILDMMSVDLELRKLKIYLRLHPMDNFKRWEEVLSSYSGQIRLMRTLDPGKDKIEILDMEELTKQILNASLILNIASTISIDASILDKAAICLGFHPSSEEESISYYKYHFSSHYKIISQFKANPIVTSMGELKCQMLNALELPELFKNERSELVRYFVGNGNVLSADLIFDNLINA